MLLQHVKELIEIVFQLISVTKVQHFGRALSVSVRLCPFVSEYVRICLNMSVSVRLQLQVDAILLGYVLHGYRGQQLVARFYA